MFRKYVILYWLPGKLETVFHHSSSPGSRIGGRRDVGRDVVVAAGLGQPPPEARVLRQLLHHRADHLGRAVHRLRVVRRRRRRRHHHGRPPYARGTGRRGLGARRLRRGDEALVPLLRRGVLGGVAGAVQILVLLLLLCGPTDLLVAGHGVDVLAVDGNVQVVEGVQTEEAVIPGAAAVATSEPFFGSGVAAAAAAAVGVVALRCCRGRQRLSYGHGLAAAAADADAANAGLLQPAVALLAAAAVLVAQSKCGGGSRRRRWAAAKEVTAAPLNGGGRRGGERGRHKWSVRRRSGEGRRRVLLLLLLWAARVVVVGVAAAAHVVGRGRRAAVDALQLAEDPGSLAGDLTFVLRGSFLPHVLGKGA